jgi:hypothetical protein
MRLDPTAAAATTTTTTTTFDHTDDSMDSLLEVPEAKKLRKLDAEMTRVLNEHEKPLKQRLKEHSEMLTQYKEAMEKLQRRGSTSVLSQQPKDPASTFQDVLEKQGVHFDGDKVRFPQRAGSGKRRSYPKTTYDRAVEFLTSQDTTSLGEIEDIVNRVFALIKNEKSVVENFPVLKKLRVDQLPKFNGRWNKM